MCVCVWVVVYRLLSLSLYIMSIHFVMYRWRVPAIVVIGTWLFDRARRARNFCL